MKKLILSFILFSFIGLNGLYAQCTPDGSITDPGTYPDSATGLPHAKVGTSYSTVIQIRVLTDTAVTGLGNATVDSIIINNVTGLPSGFSYLTNPASGHFPGGSNGCVLLTGNAPVTTMEGTYPLNIAVTAYGKLGGIVPAQLPYNITYYKVVIDSANVGVNDLSGSSFAMTQNSPNPVIKQTTINYSIPGGGKAEFNIYNLLGKVVYQKKLYAEKGVGKIILEAKDFAPGIYMYSITNGKSTLTRRMVMSAAN